MKDRGCRRILHVTHQLNSSDRACRRSHCRVRRYAVGPLMHSFCLVGRVRVNRRRSWFIVMCEDGAVADWQLTVVLCVESGLLGACRFFALARLGVRLGGGGGAPGGPAARSLVLVRNSYKQHHEMPNAMPWHGIGKVKISFKNDKRAVKPKANTSELRPRAPYTAACVRAHYLAFCTSIFVRVRGKPTWRVL